MKTRFKRIGKRSVSVLLSVLMVLSTVFIAGATTVDKENSGSSLEVQSSSAALDINSSGSDHTVLIRGENLTTLANNNEVSWAEIPLSETGTSDIYMVDINIPAQWTAFRFVLDNVDRGRSGTNEAGKNRFSYENSSAGSWKPTGETGGSMYFGSVAGNYRALFNASNGQCSFRSLSLVLLSAGVYDHEGGTAAGWTPANGFTFSKVSDNDYAVDVYISDAAKAEAGGFKLYSPDGVYITYNGSITPSSTKNAVSFATYGGSGNSAYLNGDAGNYTIHYDPTDYSVWITPATITTSSVTCATELTNGSIVADKTANVTEGDTVTITGTPSTGYYTSSVTVTYTDSNSTQQTVPTTRTGANTFTFEMPGADASVTATFAEDVECTVTGAVGSGMGDMGSVDPEYEKVSYGTPVTITATAEDRYKFTGWTLSGDYILADGSDTSTSPITILPTGNVTVTASFASTNATRIYFHDKCEMGLPQVYMWYDSNTHVDWVSSDYMMTPVPGYVNFYYVDIVDGSAGVGFNIKGLLFKNMYRSIGGANGDQDMGSCTLNCMLAQGKSLSDYEGYVFVGETTYSTTYATGNSYEGPKYNCTVPDLNSTAKQFDTYKESVTKVSADNGYYRIYFQDKTTGTTDWSGKPVYVQYGIASSDFTVFDPYKNAIARSKNSNDYQKYYPGKRMIQVSNSNYQGRVFYADIPIFDTDNSSTRRVRFTDGYQTTGTHITKSIQYPSDNNKIAVLNSHNADSSYHATFGNCLYDLRAFTDYDDTTHEEIITSSNTVNIWAKPGTVRNSGESRNDHTYSDYIAATDFCLKEDSSKPTKQNLFFQKVKFGQVEKGKTITITTTINDDNKNKRYVKAFCINGYSYGIISEPSANDLRRTSGVYTYDFKIPANTKETDFEITPIFFYLTDAQSDNKGNEYITFYAEDFIGPVQDTWGKTLSCYAWYNTENADDYTDGHRPCLGGYPGQPMVYEHGSHYMQVPKYSYYSDGTSNLIQGVTLNNYYWDDVHYFYGDGNKNCQTYDYDDFVALMKYDNLENIYFNFKYRTVRDNNPSGNWSNANEAIYTTYGTSGNGWDPLVDVYDNAVDVFGNRIADSSASNTKYLKESDIAAMRDANATAYSDGDNSTNPENDFLYIVSNGYVSDERAYIGYYATKWSIYNKEGMRLAQLPPSAFVFQLPYEYLDNTTPLPLTPPADFLAYSDKAKTYTNRNALWNEYVKIGNARMVNGTLKLGNVDTNNGEYEEGATFIYRYMPALITYEKAIESGSQNGYRNDGRWYFSRKGEKISAKTIIQYDDGTGTFVDDPYTSASSNVGGTTGAHAYFTNNEFYKKTESGDVIQSSKSSFTFKADETAEGTNGKFYEFVGWYMITGVNNLASPIYVGERALDTLGERAMITNATFVARYKEIKPEVDDVSTGVKPCTLIVNHNPYSTATVSTNDPAVHNGDGTTAVTSVKINYTNASGLAAKTITNSDTSLTIQPADLKNAESVEITLTSIPGDTSASVFDIYYKNGSTYNKSGKYDANTAYTNPEGAKTANTNTITDGVAETTYKFNISDLFDFSESNTTAETKALNFYADFSTRTITFNVKYYDRKIVNNSPTTISDEPTVASVTVTAATGQKISDLITSKLITNAAIDKYIGNVIDSYMVWPTQTLSAEEVQKLANLKEPADAKYVTENSTSVEAVAGVHYKKYSASTFTASEGGEAITPDWNYHTDYYGWPKGDYHYAYSSNYEKWVTYYDANGKEATYNEETGEGIENVASVTIWTYNTPKTYHIDIFTPAGTEDTSFVRTGDVSENIGEDLYYCNTEGTVYTRQIGFFNQRLGGNDTFEATSTAGSNLSVDYLTNYGSIGGYVGTDINALSVVNAAPENNIYRAKNSSDETTYGYSYVLENGGIENFDPVYEYAFDGWYAADDNGAPLYKITSDRTYSYRITTSLKITACYKKVTIGQTSGGVAGLSLTDNSYDYYVVNGVEKVRVNTQANIYGVGDSNANDAISKLNMIYVQIPAVYTYNNETRRFTGSSTANVTEGVTEGDVIEEIVSTVRTKVINGDFNTTGPNIVYISDITVGNGATEPRILDYTYDVAKANGSYKAVLTNKNRFQFVLNMNAADFNAGGKYSALIALGAVKIDGNWYNSDNWINYIQNEEG